MAADIQLKRSSVAGKKPDTGNVQVGEPVVNLTDRVIYTKDGTGNIIKIAAGNLQALADVSNATPSVNQVLTWDGNIWLPSDAATGNASPTSNTANVIITTSLLNNFQYADFTANGTGTSFELDFAPPSANAVIVFVNSVIQEPVTNFLITGNTLVFTSAPETDANISVRSLTTDGNSITISSAVILETGNVQFDSALITGNLKAKVYIDDSNRRLLIKDATGNVVWGD